MALPKLPTGFTWAEGLELGSPELLRLSRLSWPRFLLEESDIPDPVLKFRISVRDLKERFHVYGIRHVPSGILAAFIQAVQVEVDPRARELPDLGWRFSIQDAARRSPKNAMSLVEASIDPDFRGLGLSRMLIDRMKEETRARQLELLIAPVRPTRKARFPDEPIETYCGRRGTDGRIFDPWLRAHLEAGAELANICHESVCVRATLGKWREWTGLPLAQNGSHLIDGALTPLRVDADAGLGIYREPNVWVRYSLE